MYVCTYIIYCDAHTYVYTHEHIVHCLPSDKSCIMALICQLHIAATQPLKHKYLPRFQRKKEIEFQLVD